MINKKTKNYVVVITGGIGSGKTTISDKFLKIGIKVIDADKIAKKILSSNKKIKEKIVKFFGKKILNKKNNINRKKLRKRIFCNKIEKKWLNQTIHPLIYYEIKKKLLKKTKPYLILVLPLLFENKLEYLADRILVIDSSPYEQIKRVMKRDKTTKKEVKKILLNQINRYKRLKKADDIIFNKNKNLFEINKKIKILHKKYLFLSKKKEKQTF